MHQNHYFLRCLSTELNTTLSGRALVSCFSQNRDEVIFEFESAQNTFFVKADLLSERGFLSFPNDYKRARKNSVNLFPEIVKQSVKSVKVHENERSFQIEFSQEWLLVFKLFGRSSNVILYQGQSAKSSFKSRLEADLEVPINKLDRKIDQTREKFISEDGDLRSLFPTFGKLVNQYLKSKGYETLSLSQKWELIQATLLLLKDPSFYLIDFDGKIHLSLLPIGELREQHSNAIDAANAFSHHYFNVTVLNQEKSRILKQLNGQIKKGQNYIAKTEQKLNEISDQKYSQIADVIMANLHAIKPNQSKAELHNFYNDLPLIVKLNPKLSAQKNAEKYYLKSKNQGLETARLKENIQAKLKEIEPLQKRLIEIESINHLRELRKQTQDQVQNKPEIENLPYHKFELDGFVVLVGKNAKLNDRLTLNYAAKDDLWFHAKDVPGSHIILKQIPGKTYPTPTIEKVAQLAAWYSKGKNFPLCPVIYTPKKYVRKPKGFAPGMVKVEREEVILVEPQRVTS